MDCGLWVVGEVMDGCQSSGGSWGAVCRPSTLCGWPLVFITRRHHNQDGQRGLQWENTTLPSAAQRYPTQLHHRKNFWSDYLRLIIQILAKIDSLTTQWLSFKTYQTLGMLTVPPGVRLLDSLGTWSPAQYMQSRE